MTLLQLKPEQNSLELFGITRSKAKMYEFQVPEDAHIKIDAPPGRIFPLAIGILGDFSALASRSFASANNSPVDKSGYQQQLRFCARFFDAYLGSKLDGRLDVYLLFMAAVSYYLADLPGSAYVISRQLVDVDIDLEAKGIENIVVFCLTMQPNLLPQAIETLFDGEAQNLVQSFTQFERQGRRLKQLKNSFAKIRNEVYQSGSPRSLIIVDLLGAILDSKVQNSSWRVLPKFSGLSLEHWRPYLRKPRSIHEFWPAQLQIGRSGTFQGDSSVIQMPTSAGKTKSLELIIRSYFLRSSKNTAVIIAPFRALCTEIRHAMITAFAGELVDVDGLTDLNQADYLDMLDSSRSRIIISTPEKFLFVMRQSAEFSEEIGLIAFDEGHQFDSGIRGITYELLLTSLKGRLAEGTQIVLISAVMSNASAIGQWLIGDNAKIISGMGHQPTLRSVAIASFEDQEEEQISSGRLKFLGESDLESIEFDAPRVIQQAAVPLRGREYIQRYFPGKTEPQEIALHLGFRLIKNGSVAIYCGNRKSVVRVCRTALHAFDRGLVPDLTANSPDEKEQRRLAALYRANLGDSVEVTKAAALGIFSHHGATPQGLRSSVEYAMRLNKIQLVVCTSTLAQGVNLPIRYLLVTTSQQGADKISVRDFHNLMGRAGRAGMHTEGSIIFTDPRIIDARFDRSQQWRWNEYRKLIRPENSEPIGSSILILFLPFRSDDGQATQAYDPVEFTRRHLNGEAFADILEYQEVEFRGPRVVVRKYESAQAQISLKVSVIEAIQNFILENEIPESDGELPKDPSEIVKETLAYSMAEERDRAKLIEIFRIIGEDLSKLVSDGEVRSIIRKSSLSVTQSLWLISQLKEKLDEITNADNITDLLDVLWPLMTPCVSNSEFKKCTKPEALRELVEMWRSGKPYSAIHTHILSQSIKLSRGRSQPQAFKIEQVVSLCDGAFSYEMSMIVGSVLLFYQSELKSNPPDSIALIARLQRQLKYGLSDNTEIGLYELGFSDRVVCQDVAKIMTNHPVVASPRTLLRLNEVAVANAVSAFPAYFDSILTIQLR